MTAVYFISVARIARKVFRIFLSSSIATDLSMFGYAPRKWHRK
jgi:hypothetical protein